MSTSYSRRLQKWKPNTCVGIWAEGLPKGQTIDFLVSCVVEGCIAAEVTIFREPIMFDRTQLNDIVLVSISSVQYVSRKPCDNDARGRKYTSEEYNLLRSHLAAQPL